MYHLRAARLAAVAVMALTIIVFAGCGGKDDPGQAGDKPVPVTVAQAKKEDISATTVVTGKVTPASEVMIIPKVPGKVARVPVDVGSRVKKGDLLVKIDTTDLEISLSAAVNGMQNAKLNHNQAVLNYNNAKSNYERIKSLYKEGAVSQQQLEQAELQYNITRDAMNQPMVESAQNQIDTIRNQIANATITSPIDGEVATRSIDPGEMAGPSQPVISVVNIDKVFIEGMVAERDISLISVGQEVSVKVDAAGGSFTGIVTILSPVADPQTKGYPVKVEIDNRDRKLKPGMFGEIRLITQEKKGALVIPKEVLVTRGSDKMLYILKNGTVEERAVETGIDSDDLVEIVKGLEAGEKFVSEGQHSLFDGARVTVRGGEGADAGTGDGK